jgi:hypothetical protein
MKRSLLSRMVMSALAVGMSPEQIVVALRDSRNMSPGVLEDRVYALADSARLFEAPNERLDERLIEESRPAPRRTQVQDVDSSTAQLVARDVEQILRKELELSVSDAAKDLLRAMGLTAKATKVLGEPGKSGLRRWLLRLIEAVGPQSVLEAASLLRSRAHSSSAWPLRGR